MSSGISETGIMRIIVIFLHESILSDSSNEEPKRDGNKHSLPEAAVDHVPHLLIEEMDLLKASNVILFSWSIGQSPNSEIMHV